MMKRPLLPAFLFLSSFILLPSSFSPASPLPHFHPSEPFHEQTLDQTLPNGVLSHTNAPADFDPAKPTHLILYFLPNGNTIPQTLGHLLAPGDDWHYDIQHLAAQTRLLRHLDPTRNTVLTLLQAPKKSWPAFRADHPTDNPQLIRALVQSTVDQLQGQGASGKGQAEEIKNGDVSLSSSPSSLAPRPSPLAPSPPPLSLSLTAHSGGGSALLAYLNAPDPLPPYVTRIAFLDANYSYSDTPPDHHGTTLLTWLQSSPKHHLIVFCYDDRNITLNGNKIISDTGGTYRATHRMLSFFASQGLVASPTTSPSFAKPTPSGVGQSPVPNHSPHSSEPLPPRHAERSEESHPSDHPSPSLAESPSNPLASSRNSPPPTPDLKGPFTHYSFLNGQAQFFLHPNPQNKILHTALIGEMNAFLEALTTDTPLQSRYGSLGGPRAYSQYITPSPVPPTTAPSPGIAIPGPSTPSSTQSSALSPQHLPLPPRPNDAPTGSALLKQIEPLPLNAREQLISKEILSGNVPSSLRTLTPITVTAVGPDAQHTATYYVTPDVLSVGTDSDSFRTPLTPLTAQLLADKLDCSLITRKISNDIYTHATIKLDPHPLTERRESPTTFYQHHQIIQSQLNEQQQGGPTPSTLPSPVGSASADRSPPASGVVASATTSPSQRQAQGFSPGSPRHSEPPPLRHSERSEESHPPDHQQPSPALGTEPDSASPDGSRSEPPSPPLLAGHKKDVVITPLLKDHPHKVAIYGWHLPTGKPIQPLYLGHSITYVDYSHGIRLLSNHLLVDNHPTTVQQVLSSPTLSPLLSDEGPLPTPRYPTTFPSTTHP